MELQPSHVSAFMSEKDAVDSYAFEKKDLNLTLSVEDWAILEELVKVLKPVEDVSLLFCKDTISTIDMFFVPR
jgi:hypothetical protein